MAQRTYIGHAPSGRQLIADRSVAFVRDVPVDVSDDEAKFLDGDPDWSTPKKPSKPPKQGSEPDPKES